MTELRRDFLTGEWVAISTVRAERPFDSGGMKCPFCPENEHMTPPATYRSGQVRAFANKYPALTQDSPEGYGIHEVLVDTEIHDQRLHELSEQGLTEVFLGLQNRILALGADERVKYVQVFKNQGRAAGASLTHSHWQILALPVLPARQLNIRRAFEEYFKDTGRCYLCEPKPKELLVLEDGLAIAHAPYASPYADGVDIMPRRHVPDFSMLSAEEYAALARALLSVLGAMLKFHPGIGYNICIQSGAGDASHVFMQVIPRLGSLAGFELATGCFINSVNPKQTARRFREQIARTE